MFDKTQNRALADDVGSLSLGDVRRLVTGFAAGFDAALVDPSDLTRALHEAATIENAGAVLKALLGARLAETDRWRSEGFNDPADQMARLTGSSTTRAREAINAGRRLDALEATAGAARTGGLSIDQTAAIADAAAANPSVEQRLLGQAKDLSLRQLNEECAKAKAAVEDLEARDGRIHRARRLRSWTDRDGVWHLTVTNTTTAGAVVMAAVNVARDQAFDQARRNGRREGMDAYAADGLTNLSAAFSAGPTVIQAPTTSSATNTATNCSPPSPIVDTLPFDPASAGPAVTPIDPGSPVNGGGDRRMPVPNRGGWRDAKIIFLVSLDSYRRGNPVDGETCEIAGLGPVPISTIEAALESGDPFVAAVLFDGVDVASVAHLGRRPTAHQLTALQALGVSCVGCGSRHNLQIHHVEPWAAKKRTELHKLRFVCGRCHDLITHKHWDIDADETLVPPGDPRHPRTKPPPDSG